MSIGSVLSGSGYVPRAVFYISLAAATAGLSGCGGGKLKFELDPEPVPDISVEEVSAESDDGTIYWSGSRVIVPGRLEGYDYNSERQCALLKYGPEEAEAKKKAKSANFVLFDLEEGYSRWSARSNATGFLYAQEMVLFSGKSRGAYEDVDGSYIGEWTGPLLLYDGMVFRFDSKEYSRLDLRTGVPIWTREGSAWVGWRNDYYNDGWMFVIAKGVHALDMKTGEGWDQKLETYSESYAKAVAAEAALACMAAMAGTYSSGAGMQAEVTHNCYSNPVFADGRMYIADRERIYCFDEKKGDVIWQTELNRDYGSSYLGRAGESLALVAKGYKFRDMVLRRDETPSVTLFDMETGEAGAYYEMDHEDIAASFIWSADRAILMTSTHIYQFDHDLQLLAARESDEFLGEFQGIIRSSDEEILIRTYDGILAISPETLEERWKNGIGRIPVNDEVSYNDGNRWMKPFFDSSGADDIFVKGGLHWMYTDDGRLLGVDMEDMGRVVFEMQLGTKKVFFHPDCVFAADDSGVFYLPYRNLEIEEEDQSIDGIDEEIEDEDEPVEDTGEGKDQEE